MGVIELKHKHDGAAVNSALLRRPIRRWFALFMGPMVVAFAIGFVYPFCKGIYLSFCKFKTTSDAEFIGLGNYVKALSDDSFLYSFGYTAMFTLVSLVLINVLAFAVAYALTQGIKGSNLFRTVFFMPNLIGGIVLGYVWSMIFDGILSHLNTSILMETKYGFWGLIILMCWQQIGYMMIIYIAGLQAVPEDMLEAAKIEEAAAIDGCNPLRTFFSVVFPMLRPTMISVGILEIMWVWNDYLLPYLVLDRQKYMTIPIHIQYLKGSYGTVDLGATMALIFLSIVPVIIFYLCCQKYIIKGVAAGAVKG